jgi:hypothetical protein
VLERPASVVAPLARTTRVHSPHGLAAWIRAVAAIARAARFRIDLGSPGARYHAASARLVEELAELPDVDGAHAPRLYLEGPELEALLEAHPELQPAVERLLAAGRLLPAWSSSEGTFAGPGCERRVDERGLVACAGAVALNLPRIARRAGPFREELFQSALAELVQASVEIAGALCAQLPPSSGVRARSAVALVPVGLREALRILGDGAIDVDLAARTLGFLGEAARRFGRDGALARLPSPFHGEEAAARFAFLDARATQAEGARQEWLFGEAEAALGEVRPYSTGFLLSPAGGPAPLANGRAEAEALRTVSSGALDLAPFADAPGASERAPLDAWRRFEVVHRSHTGELVLELFPREERAARLRPLA